MKRLLVCLFVLIGSTLLLTPASSFAQTKIATSEQSLQELVTEVRQLRAALQRMNAAVYKGQVMLERLRLHQEQVNRIERELRDTQDTLSDMQGAGLRIREMFGRVDAGVGTGVINEKERTSLEAELKMINQRQQRATTRETQLQSELAAERSKLNEINNQLNMLLEREL